MLIRSQVIDKEIQPPWSILTLLRGVFGHLSRWYRIKRGFYFALMLANNLAEMLSLAAVIPFLVVISELLKVGGKPWQWLSRPAS